MTSTYLSPNENIKSMPVSVAELSNTQSTLSVTAINRQSCLSRPLVYPQHWIASAKLKEKKIFSVVIWSVSQQTEVQDDARIA